LIRDDCAIHKEVIDILVLTDLSDFVSVILKFIIPYLSYIYTRIIARTY